MDKLYSSIPKKTLALIAGLIIIIITLILILIINQPKKAITPPPPVISQSPTTSFLFQKSIIGKTTPTDIEKAYQVKDKRTLANSDLEYSLDSKLQARPDQIIFHNNLAQFERTVVLGKTNASNYLKISDQIIKYGPAEKIIRGSKFYGYFRDTYIYATRGFAFIANTNADEIFEIQLFNPTSLDNYLSKYGDDIQENKGIKEGI